MDYSNPWGGTSTGMMGKMGMGLFGGMKSPWAQRPTGTNGMPSTSTAPWGAPQGRPAMHMPMQSPMMPPNPNGMQHPAFAMGGVAPPAAQPWGAQAPAATPPGVPSPAGQIAPQPMPVMPQQSSFLSGGGMQPPAAPLGGVEGNMAPQSTMAYQTPLGTQAPTPIGQIMPSPWTGGGGMHMPAMGTPQPAAGTSSLSKTLQTMPSFTSGGGTPPQA